MHDPLLSYPGYSLRRANNALMAALATRLAPLGMRQTEASVMMLIGANPGVTASALGRQLDIQRANMVPLLNRLEDAGLIIRAPIDRKSQGLELTAEGREKLSQVVSEIDHFEREMLDRIPEEHRDHLLPALQALWR